MSIREGDTIMSAEDFPNTIPFDELERLRKCDIEVEFDGSTATLVGPDGKTIVAHRDDNGNAVFSGDMTAMFRDVIAREWQIDLFPKIQRDHVVVEGLGRDFPLVSRLLEAAIAYNEVLEVYLEHGAPELDPAPANVDFVCCVDFGHTMLELIRKGLGADAFCFHLHNSYFGHEFALMVDVGFFKRVNGHYVFAVPPDPSMKVIANALTRILETEDDRGFLHPERYLVTMTKFDAKNLCKSLRKRSRKEKRSFELTPAGHEALASASWVDNGAGAQLG
jgi:hypothetical protein